MTGSNLDSHLQASLLGEAKKVPTGRSEDEIPLISSCPASAILHLQPKRSANYRRSIISIAATPRFIQKVRIFQ